MSEIERMNLYVPLKNLDDWRNLLADRERHWRPGYSAMKLATSWLNSKNFPKIIENIFRESEIDIFQNTKILFAIPEYKVNLPGGSRPSQNDIFILSKGGNELISIMVEGKAEESFDKSMEKWKNDMSEGKKHRLKFLLSKINLENVNIDKVRYQLIHRAASAIIEADNFRARNALLLIHSFSKEKTGYEDYSNFVSLYGIKGEMNKVQGPRNLGGINLFFLWVSDLSS